MEQHFQEKVLRQTTGSIFPCCIIQLWKSLPQNMTDTKSTNRFRNRIRLISYQKTSCCSDDLQNNYLFRGEDTGVEEGKANSIFFLQTKYWSLSREENWSLQTCPVFVFRKKQRCFLPTYPPPRLFDSREQCIIFFILQESLQKTRNRASAKKISLALTSDTHCSTQLFQLWEVLRALSAVQSREV